MSQFGKVNFPLILVLSALFEVVVCTVVMSPQGNEFICSTSSVSISRTLTCNVSGTNLRWDISIMGNSPKQYFFVGASPGVTNDPYNVSGIIASLTTATSDAMSSELVIPNNRTLLPVAIKCRAPGLMLDLTYSLMLKDPPDKPTNISVSRTMEGRCNITWQPPASSHSENKPVEMYNLTITPVTSSSYTQVLITTNTSISLHLSDSTNYTVSLKASNCAGDSPAVIYEITGHIVKLLPPSSTTTTTTTIATMSFGSTIAASNSEQTMSPQTSGGVGPITSDPSLGNPTSFSPLSGLLLAIIGAVVAVIVLLVILIMIVIGIIVCYRRRSRLKTVSMETATNANQGSDVLGENGIYNKLKAYPSFETPELTKHFHNPQYSELMQSSTSSEKGEPLSPNEPIYHVLEGPDPSTKDQLYAEVGDPGSSYNSNHERWPDKNSVTTENVRLNPQISSHTTSTHLKYHQTPPSKFPVHTWNYSIH